MEGHHVSIPYSNMPDDRHPGMSAIWETGNTTVFAS